MFLRTRQRLCTQLLYFPRPFFKKSVRYDFTGRRFYPRLTTANTIVNLYRLSPGFWFNVCIMFFWQKSLVCAHATLLGYSWLPHIVTTFVSRTLLVHSSSTMQNDRLTSMILDIEFFLQRLHKKKVMGTSRIIVRKSHNHFDSCNNDRICIS